MFKNKRILAFLLALVMVFGTVLPVTSFAEEGDADEPGVPEEVEDTTTPERVEEIFFRIYNQENVELTGEQTAKVTFQDGVNNPEDVSTNFETDYYAELSTEDGKNVYRLHSIKPKENESEAGEFKDGFKDGKYTVSLTTANAFTDEPVFEFTVKDGKVVAQGEEDGSVGDPFKVKGTTPENNLHVYFYGADEDVKGKTVTVHRIQRTADNKYKFEDGKPVLGDSIATSDSDNLGYAGMNYTVNANGTISFGSKTIAVGEMLAITYGEKEGVVPVGAEVEVSTLSADQDVNQENAQILNLWRVKDEYKAQYDRVDDYKAVLNEPVQNLEALATQTVNFILPEENTDITLRVRIETTGNRAHRLPVPNSLVRISKPTTIEHGKVVELGKTVTEGKTNEAGYVEFTLPAREVVKMFLYLGDNDKVHQGKLSLQDQEVPYLITQVDNGGNEGVTKSDEIYTLANAKYDGGSNLFELYIRNEMDLAYRISGPDRYATAVEIAKENYPKGLQKFDGKTRVIVASGESYPDALTATTTSYYYNAPLILVTKNAIPEATLEYIKAEKPDEIVVIGGDAAISKQVYLGLQEAAGAEYLNRIYGKDRYGTSVANANNLLKLKNESTGNTLVKGFFGNEAKIFVAAGDNFPDALAVAAPAADKGYPLLLVGKNYYPPVVKKWIEDNFVKNAYIIGGEAAISKDIQLAIGNTGSVAVAKRDYGRDRAATSVIIGQTYFPNANHVYVTSGAVFADALTGSTLAAKNGYPVILLPNADTVSEEIVEYLENSNITSFTVLGGDATVTPKARQEISRILLGK